MATQGVACVHNLMLGAFTAVGSGSDWVIDGVIQRRYTPYHIPHRTEVAGFMTILHGDDRFYNNIFVQNWKSESAKAIQDMGFASTNSDQVGTAIFDDFPTYDEWIAKFELDKPADMIHQARYHFERLPVWVNGNAYFNGAAACKNEANRLVDESNHVEISLIEEDGKYTLCTNLYDFLKEFRVGIINSDTLGCAFEPEQRFENPDGSAILFDSDYHGGHRGVDTLPGPFASAEEARKQIW